MLSRRLSTAPLPAAIDTDWNPENLRHPNLRALFSYWRALKGDSAVASRAAFSPADLVPLLPFVLLVDVARSPRAFRFRLTGTAIRDFTGQEMTGKTIEQVFPRDFALQVHFHWSTVVDQ